MPRILPIRLTLSNAFLVLDERPVLVDCGLPRDVPRIERRLARAGVRPCDLSLIVLTHGHSDHAGGAAELAARTGAPVAIHTADAELLRAGRMRALQPLTPLARAAQAWLTRDYPPYEPEILLEEGQSLERWGWRAGVVATPGHTLGSITCLAEGGAAFAGDVLSGGWLNGWILPSRPCWPYFAEDLEALRRSVRKLLGFRPHTIYLGHGGPLRLPAVDRWSAASVAPEGPLLEGAPA